MAYSNLTDDQLLLEIKKGDETAFVTLYDTYWKKLYNYGYSKLGKREIIEGFVQEIFIDLWVKRASLDIHSSLASYLFTSIKYKIINYHKSQSIRENYAVNEKSKGELKITEVEEKVLYQDLKLNLDQVIFDFPMQRKTACTLRFNEELSYQEIALAMAISVSSVEKHIIKSLKIIRYRLKTFGFAMITMMMLEINF